MQLRASATDGRIQRALLIAVAVVCVISMGSSAAASESQVPTEGGVATLQDCFVQKKRLMAVVLVDESASLKGYGVRAATDPDNEARWCARFGVGHALPTGDNRGNELGR